MALWPVTFFFFFPFLETGSICSPDWSQLCRPGRLPTCGPCCPRLELQASSRHTHLLFMTPEVSLVSAIMLHLPAPLHTPPPPALLCSHAFHIGFLTVLLSEPPEGPTSSGSVSLQMHPSSGPLHTVCSFGNTLISCLFTLVNFSSSFRVCCLLQEVCQVLLRRAPAYACPYFLVSDSSSHVIGLPFLLHCIALVGKGRVCPGQQ